MNLDELRSALDTERQKGGLQGLRDSFYQEVAEYVEDQKAERDELAAEADDPFGSADVQRLSNEIETARTTAESLYERRLGKLVKQASLAAADMASEDQVEGLTTEERTLYDDLVGRIEANKEHMLEVVAGEADGPAPDAEPLFDPDPASDPNPPDDSDRATADSSSTDDAAQSDSASSEAPSDDARSDPSLTAAEARAVAAADEDGVSAADVMGDDPSGASADDGPEPNDTDGDAGPDTPENPGQTDGDEADDVERTPVRITEDVGDIFGVDEREYQLNADDVVLLPTANAEPLVDNEAAERLE